MKEIITLGVISGLLLVVFIATLIIGLTKKNRKAIFLSIVIFVPFICLSAWTGYKLISKSYSRVVNMVKPRTGEEIYLALFGKPQSDCLKVINYQDQIVPKIDYAIKLQFETCPSELNRILKLHNFKMEKQSNKDLQTKINLDWFETVTSNNDSILAFKYNKDEYGNNIQIIYASPDSTKAYCIDILD